MAYKSRRINNINGASLGPLKNVPYVDNSDKFINAAVKESSSKDKSIMQNQLQAIKQMIRDASEYDIELDAKLSDNILGRIASLLDEAKANDISQDDLNQLKDDILDEIDQSSFMNVIQNFLASRISNLFDDDAKKDDIEDLKSWMLENIKYTSSTEEQASNVEKPAPKEEEPSSSESSSTDKQIEDFFNEVEKINKNEDEKTDSNEDESNTDEIISGQTAIQEQLNIFNSKLENIYASSCSNGVAQKTVFKWFSSLSEKIKTISGGIQTTISNISNNSQLFINKLVSVGSVIGSTVKDVFFKSLKLFSWPILGAIGLLGTSIFVLARGIKFIIGGIGKLFKSILSLGWSIITLPFKLIKGIFSILNPMNLIMTIVKSKIIWIATIIGLIVFGLYKAWKHIGDIGKWIWGKLIEFGNWIWEQLPSWINSTWEFMKDLGKWLWPKLVEFGKWLWSKLPDWINAAWEFMKDLGKWLWPKLVEFGKWLWSKLPGWINKAWEFMKDLGKWLWPKLVEFGKWLWSKLPDWINAAWEFMKDLGKWLWPKLVEFGKWIWQQLPGWINSTWEFMKDFGKWIWDKLIEFGNWIWEQLPGWINSTWEFMKDFGAWIWNKLIEFGNWLWEQLPGWINSTWEFMKDFGAWIWNKLCDFGNWLWEYIKGFVKDTIIDGLVDWYNQSYLKVAIDTIVDLIHNYVIAPFNAVKQKISATTLDIAEKFEFEIPSFNTNGSVKPWNWTIEWTKYRPLSFLAKSYSEPEKRIARMNQGKSVSELLDAERLKYSKQNDSTVNVEEKAKNLAVQQVNQLTTPVNELSETNNQFSNKLIETTNVVSNYIQNKYDSILQTGEKFSDSFSSFKSDLIDYFNSFRDDIKNPQNNTIIITNEESKSTNSANMATF